MKTKILQYMSTVILLGALAACGGVGGTSALNSFGSVPVFVTDGPSDNWAVVGVKILSISLIPQSGNPVSVYEAPSPVPTVNFVQLDGVADLLGGASVPQGTYTGAQIVISANQGDVTLIASGDPDKNFPAAAGTAIPSSQIQIQGATGNAGNRVVTVNANFDTPVTFGDSTPINLDFNIGHPAFDIDHTIASGQTQWAISFNSGEVRPYLVTDLSKLVLRHTYGTVAAVAADGSSLTVTKVLPIIPVTSPETYNATATQQTIKVDSTNGTIIRNLDSATPGVVVKSFTDQSLGSLLNPGLPQTAYLRIAARYQPDGSLVATRIFASDTAFDKVWVSPEGHVLHVHPQRNTVTITGDSGQPQDIIIDPFTTQFSFKGQSVTLPQGANPLVALNIRRGFKINADVAAPAIATQVDIETAIFEGYVTDSTTSSFSFSRKFSDSDDEYLITLPYVENDFKHTLAGSAVRGFAYWSFAYPTLLTYDNNSAIGVPNTAIASFVTLSQNTINLGDMGNVGTKASTRAVWDPTSGWKAPFAILLPTKLPRALVVVPSGASTGLVGSVSPYTLQVTFWGASTPTTINLSATSGSATLVYQVSRGNDVVTVTPIDITTGLATLQADLVTGSTVRVYGIPQSDGSVNAYTMTVFTGDQPDQD